MDCAKIDVIIGVVAFIILVAFFSFQPYTHQNIDYAAESEQTGGGTQTAGSDSDIMLPSEGDAPAESEDIEKERVESPQTGDIGWRRTGIYAVFALATAASCITTNKKHIGSCIK